MSFLLELIKKVLYLIPIIIIASILFIVGHYTLKNTGLIGNGKSFASNDFLPTPGTFTVITGKAPTPTDTPTGPSPINTTSLKYPTYTYNNITTEYTQANSQVRNIVLGRNNTLYSGAMVSGSAREGFLNNGKFSVVLLNQQGQIIATTVAVSTGESETTYDIWIPWQAKFGFIPPQSSGVCTLVFQNQNSTGNTALSKIIRIPANCE